MSIDRALLAALVLWAIGVTAFVAGRAAPPEPPAAVAFDTAWTCGCGAVNGDGASKCTRCGGKKK